MKNNKVLYQLTVDDFQNVAYDEINRHLSDEELIAISEWVSNNIPWYELISDAITEKLKHQIEN